MKRHRTFAFILHGNRAGQDDVRRLVEWVRERGHTIHPRVTWEAGDATRFTREAVACNVDAVVALGGDGTVNEVINGLDGSEIPLGIIPLGTANDFAKQAGLPGDIDHAMDVILRRAPVRMDTGQMNGRRFINASVGGVGAEATAETPPEAKELLGRFAYAITGVRKLADLTPARGMFTGDGLELDCEFLLFAVANMATTGGGTRIAPRASVTDGLLDVMVVKAMPRAEFARLLPRIRRGDHLGADGVLYFQLPALRVESDSPITINADGEPSHAACADYRCRPLDLVVHLPKVPTFETSEEKEQD